jgi:hypothetical protein
VSTDLVATASPEPELLGFLIVLSSPDPTRRGAVIELTEPLLVLSRASAGAGSALSCARLEFADGFMSRDHALLRARPSFSIEERKRPSAARNGTLRNGRRLLPGQPTPLCDGDRLRLGETELVFRAIVLPKEEEPQA